MSIGFNGYSIEVINQEMYGTQPKLAKGSKAIAELLNTVGR